MGDIDVIINHPNELAVLFPGIQADKFKIDRRGANLQWAGPCPFCGGEDRFIVKSAPAKVYCRQCSSFKGKKGAYVASLMREKNPSWKPDPAQTEVWKKKILDLEEKKAIRRISSIKSLTRDYLKWHKKVDYDLALSERHLLPHTVDHFCIGLKPWENSSAWTIPYLKDCTIDGQYDRWCTNMKYRLRDPDIKGKYRSASDLGVSWFDATYSKCRWSVIVEGEFKAMILWQNGISAVGIPGIESFKPITTWQIEWSERFIQPRYILLDHDPDPDKQKHEIERTKEIAQLAGVIPVYLPIPGKIDDLMVSKQILPGQLVAMLVKAEQSIITIN